jgi:hypothetical protein
MAADARLAPDLRRRAALSGMAAAEMTNYRRLALRLRELGADPEEAMAPFAAPLGAYHDQTRPRDWLEALTKAYVGDRIADDFVRAVAAALGRRDRELVGEVLHDVRYQEFAADEIRAATRADEAVRSRLSMWARRLVGEALAQATRVAADRPALTALVAGGDGDQAEVQTLFKRLTQAHAARMNAVGLNN